MAKITISDLQDAIGCLSQSKQDGCTRVATWLQNEVNQRILDQVVNDKAKREGISRKVARKRI